MSRRDSELDRLRAGRTELENHYIDELVAGRLSRRELLRRGSVIGMSVPFMTALLSATDASARGMAPRGAVAGPAAKKGGTMRIAIAAPAGAINPLTIDDAGGLCMLNQCG